MTDSNLTPGGTGSRTGSRDGGAGTGDSSRDGGAGTGDSSRDGGAGTGDGARDGGADPSRSGLRNPAAAARGVGAVALAVEVVTLLLAIVPMITLGGRGTGAAIVLIVTLAALNAVLLGLLRHGWAWYAALVPPLVLIGATWLRVALGILGSLFLLLWLFVLYVRRTVLSPPRRG